MKKMSITLAMLLILVMSSNLLAQDDEDESRDLVEVALYTGAAVPTGGLSDWNDSLGAKTGIQVGIDVGYFATPKLIIGLSFAYSQFSIDTQSPAKELNHRFFNPSAYLKYYFASESDLVPYIRVFTGLDNAKFATVVQDQGAPTELNFRELSYDPVFSFGGGVGVFYYTSDYSGLFLEGSYHYGLTKNVNGTFQGTDYPFGVRTGLLNIRLGIKSFFGTD